MLVDGRLSVRIVCPVVKFAGALPPLAKWTFQVQGVPRVVALVTLSVLTAVRSGALTTTVSEQALLVSSLSATKPLGSTKQLPPARGLIKDPVTEGVAVKVTSKDEAGAMVTDPPLAMQVRLLLTMLQAIVPVTLPTMLPALADPYAMFVFGRLSIRMLALVVKIAGAVTEWRTCSVQVQLRPRLTEPPPLVLITVRSGAVLVRLNVACGAGPAATST